MIDIDVSGGGSVELVAATQVLTRKITAKNHVVIGDDKAQLRFLSHSLGLSVQPVDRVTDDLLAGQSGLLLKVTAKHCIDLSPEMRSKTAFWSVETMAKGSAAINALLKYAGTLSPAPKGKKHEDKLIASIGDRLSKEKIEDVRSAIWTAVAALEGDYQEYKKWPEPWESTLSWIDPTMNPERRLNWLYRVLIGYAKLQASLDDAKAFCTKPSELQKIKTLTLDFSKVERSIIVLSRWKQTRQSPWICAAQISTIWV